MFCKYCGKKIDDDSISCMYCGKKLNGHKSRENDYEKLHESVRKKGTYTAPDGKTYKVVDGILYDENGWDVGKVPRWFG